jgi:hypothetical protein
MARSAETCCEMGRELHAREYMVTAEAKRLFYFTFYQSLRMRVLSCSLMVDFCRDANCEDMAPERHKYYPCMWLCVLRESHMSRGRTDGCLSWNSVPSKRYRYANVLLTGRHQQTATSCIADDNSVSSLKICLSEFGFHGNYLELLLLLQPGLFEIINSMFVLGQEALILCMRRQSSGGWY